MPDVLNFAVEYPKLKVYDAESTAIVFPWWLWWKVANPFG